MDLTNATASDLPRLIPENNSDPQASALSEICAVIAGILTDLETDRSNQYDESTLPEAASDLVGHPVVYTSGTAPHKVLMCLLTGTDSYGWKELSLES